MSITEITLPPGIHAEIITTRHAQTHQLVERAIVWADRTYRTCETCDQLVPRGDDRCPADLDHVGNARSVTQEHCHLGGACGVWQPVDWMSCGASDDEISATAAELASRRAEALGSERERLAAALRSDLARALTQLAGPEITDRIATGSDAEPGVYFDENNSGEWIAWDYDPDDDSETITIYASDLAA